MSESLEALRNEMFETMQRMRQRRSTPPLPPGITRGEINALMMLSIIEARGEVVRRVLPCDAGRGFANAEVA